MATARRKIVSKRTPDSLGMNDFQMDWSPFCFLPICVESSVFVSVVFVVVVFLRSRRNKKEDHIMPEKGKGDK